MDFKKLKIIDSHHHFWDLSMKKHPWLCERPLIDFRYGNYEKICKNFLFDDYMAASSNYDVLKTIHMEAEWDKKDPIGEIIWLEKNYNKFVNFRWWKRRNQAFNFILLLDRKNYNKYKSLDFFITKLVYRIFSIF